MVQKLKQQQNQNNNSNSRNNNKKQLSYYLEPLPKSAHGKLSRSGQGLTP